MDNSNHSPGKFHDFTPSWLKSTEKPKLCNNSRNLKGSYNHDDLHRQHSFHEQYNDGPRTNSFRPRNHSVDEPKYKSANPYHLNLKPSVKCLQQKSLDDDFPLLNGEKDNISTSKLGIWENSPAQKIIHPITVPTKQIKTDEFVLLKTKNGASRLRNSKLILPNNITPSLPKDIETNNSLNGSINSLSIEDRMLSSSIEAERRLLREMGWIETDETDYTITDEELQEFENLRSNQKNDSFVLSPRSIYTDNGISSSSSSSSSSSEDDC